jgi:GT2 family glycosyltransferase
LDIVLRVGRELTIAMSAYGNVGVTHHALKCLERFVAGDYELILVDDCSPDNGAIFNLFVEFRNHHKRTRVFRFDRNLEYSGSLNAILSHTSGDETLFLSNDIYLTESYLREVLAVARSNDRYGIVRGCSNFVDNGRPTHNVSGLTDLSFDGLASAAAKIAESFTGQSLVDDYLTGDAFMVKRAVIERIGTLDPAFYGYFADHDFGIRAQAAGFDLVLARGAFAGHHRAANFDYLPPQQRQAKAQLRWMRVIENWARFKLKYDLPVELIYSSINDIPWASLPGRIADNFHVPAGNYSRFEIKSDPLSGS